MHKEEVIDFLKEKDEDESNDSYWFSSGEDENSDESTGSTKFNQSQSINSDESFTLENKKIPKEANYRLTMWAANTHYEVVKEVSKFHLGYHLTKNSRANWDIAWWDGPIPMQILNKM